MWSASLIISLTFMASPWQWPSVNNNISTIIFLCLCIERSFNIDLAHWFFTILEKIHRFTYVSYANYECVQTKKTRIQHKTIITSQRERRWTILDNTVDVFARQNYYKCSQDVMQSCLHLQSSIDLSQRPMNHVVSKFWFKYKVSSF